MTTRQDAIKLIGAKRRGDDWIYYAEETQAWYRATAEELDRLAELMETEGGDAYSLWCAECGAEEVEA